MNLNPIINNFQRSIRKVQICCILILSCTACSLNIPYENQYSDPDAITTVTAARELLASAYDAIPKPEFSLSVLSDDFQPTFLINLNADLNNLYKWHPKPMEDLSNSLWEKYYSAIGIANTVLERVHYVSPISDSDKQELQCIVSEAKTLKAYCYFNLLRLFAPTYPEGPEKDGIILKERFELAFLKRSSISECVNAIRQLLTEAVTVDNRPSQVYWFSRQSAYYLLAALELYAENYDKAEEYALKILSSTNAYDVLAPVHYKKLWEQEPCEECIFSLHTTNSYYTDMNYERKKGDYFTINSTLTQLYAANDIRYEATVYPQEMPGESIGETLPVLYLGKYNKQNWNYKPIQYINKLRVSGICFILAEAYCQDQKGHDALALEVINNYLAQREAPLLDTSLSGTPLLKAILQEKWKEFAGEGERYFDLKRYRKSLLSDWNLSAAMKSKSIKSDDYRWLFPIPKGEYLYNENISQNAGWTKVEK